MGPSYLARDTATHIRLSVFKKPIFPSSLLRTSDRIIMSFSSLQKCAFKVFSFRSTALNGLPLKVVHTGDADPLTRFVLSHFLFDQEHLSQVCSQDGDSFGTVALLNEVSRQGSCKFGFMFVGFTFRIRFLEITQRHSFTIIANWLKEDVLESSAN